jgi:hypothetical protein
VQVARWEQTMFTTAEDWIERFKAADCSLRLDGATMKPSRDPPLSPECLALWDEIRGDENRERWKQLDALVRASAGPIVGWKTYP